MPLLDTVDQLEGHSSFVTSPCGLPLAIPRPECFTRGFKYTPKLSKKPGHLTPLFAWLGVRGGNITFGDSLNFDLS